MNHFFRIFFSFSIVAALVILPFTAPAKAESLAIVPRSAMKWFNLGVEQIQHDQYEPALHDFTQAIELDSDFAEAYSNRCLVFIQLGDYAQATEDCSTALTLNPNNTEAYLNRGLAYHRLRNYSGAIAEYNQVIERSQDDLRAYYNRGLARFERQDFVGAIALLMCNG